MQCIATRLPGVAGREARRAATLAAMGLLEHDRIVINRKARLTALEQDARGLG